MSQFTTSTILSIPIRSRQWLFKHLTRLSESDPSPSTHTIEILARAGTDFVCRLVSVGPAEAAALPAAVAEVLRKCIESIWKVLNTEVEKKLAKVQ